MWLQLSTASGLPMAVSIDPSYVKSIGRRKMFAANQHLMALAIRLDRIIPGVLSAMPEVTEIQMVEPGVGFRVIVCRETPDHVYRLLFPGSPLKSNANIRIVKDETDHNPS